MARFGVSVSAVEPGNFNSEIGETLQRRMENKGYKIEGSAYEAELKSMAERLANREVFKEPIEVAEAIADALGSATPKRRYLVVPNQREAEITIRQMLQETVQLNQGQPYSYDRDTLVKMLDEALTGN